MAGLGGVLALSSCHSSALFAPNWLVACCCAGHSGSMARAGSDAFDHMIKLLLVGEAGVGKSSILLRFTEDAFDDGQAAT